MLDRIKTNAMFFFQNLNDGQYLCFKSEKFIENRYKTTVWLCDYDFNERLEMAKADRKKFGFVLKSLK